MLTFSKLSLSLNSEFTLHMTMSMIKKVYPVAGHMAG